MCLDEQENGRMFGDPAPVEEQGAGMLSTTAETLAVGTTSLEVGGQHGTGLPAQSQVSDVLRLRDPTTQARFPCLDVKCFEAATSDSTLRSVDRRSLKLCKHRQNKHTGGNSSSQSSTGEFREMKARPACCRHRDKNRSPNVDSVRVAGNFLSLCDFYRIATLSKKHAVGSRDNTAMCYQKKRLNVHLNTASERFHYTPRSFRYCV